MAVHPMARKIEQIAAALENDAIMHAARAYAGIASARSGVRTGSSQEAIVAGHFRRGNARRYDFPPLSPKYAARKRKKFGNKPQLVRTGALRATIVGRGQVLRVAGGAIVRWRVPGYARHLIRQGRHPVAPDAQDRRKVREVARRWLAQVIASKRAKVAARGARRLR